MTLQKIHPDDELLIAYLDDELDLAARRQLEQRLADNDEFRARLSGLQSSWDALDELPISSSNAAFAASTMSMLALTAEHEAPHSQRTKLRLNAPWIRWCFVVGFGLLIGYLGIGLPMRLAYVARLRDLPVAYHLDEYLVARDVDFLRILDQEGVFQAEADDHGMSDESAEHPWLGLASRPRAIEAALEKLTADDQLALYNRMRRFRAMGADEQVSLRGLHRELAASPDASQLWRVLARYYDWVATLESADRAELSQLPIPQRVERIKAKLFAEMLRSQNSDSDWMDVQIGDIRHLREWTAQYLQRHRPQLLAALPPAQQGLLRQADLGKRPWILMRALATSSSQIREKLPVMSDADKLEFLEGFSPQVKQRIARQLDEHGTAALFELNNLSMQLRRGEGGRFDPKRLEDFFERLPPEEQERLLQLGPDQLPRELRRLFQDRRRSHQRMSPRPGGPPKAQRRP